MLVLGIETSCDESGVALYDCNDGLLAHKIHSQLATHVPYGGVVPELASRDHIRKLSALILELLRETGCTLDDLDTIAYTKGPGLAGALLVGASVANGLGYALTIPVIGLHHLEGHLLSALLSNPAPVFPYVALLVSGGHSQLVQVNDIGQYRLLGETLDDAAGEAFDKTAKLLGLDYPGGPALSKLAEHGRADRFRLPRPMLRSGDLNFSFSGLKTAVLTLIQNQPSDDQTLADIALAFQDAITEVLVTKAIAAIEEANLDQLVVAGGVGANKQLRQALCAGATHHGFKVFFPELEFCTDNGAMIAYAGAARIKHQVFSCNAEFGVSPRWDLEDLGVS